MTAILVNDQLLERVMRDPTLKEIGCLAGIDMVKVSGQPKRQCCGRKAQLMASVPYSKLRQCLFSLSDVDMQKLKSLLRVDQLIFYFREPGFPPRAVR